MPAVAGGSPWPMPLSRRTAEAVPDGRPAVAEDSSAPSDLCRSEECDRIPGGLPGGIGR